MVRGSGCKVVIKLHATYKFVHALSLICYCVCLHANPHLYIIIVILSNFQLLHVLRMFFTLLPSPCFLS